MEVDGRMMGVRRILNSRATRANEMYAECLEKAKESEPNSRTWNAYEDRARYWSTKAEAYADALNLIDAAYRP